MLIGLIVLSLLLGKAVANIFAKYRESVEAKQIAEAKLEELRSREAALRSDIENLESPEGLEAEMRKKFNVAAPGEQLIVVVEEAETKEGEGERGFFGAMLFNIKSWFN